MKQKLVSLFSLAVVCTVTPLLATDYYYWNCYSGESATWGNASDAGNWAIYSTGNQKKSAGWNAAASAPSNTARLGCRGDFYIDLENGARGFGVWGWGPSTAVSRQHMYLRNGTATMNAVGSDGGGDFHGGWNMSPAEVHITSTAKLVQNASGSGPIYFNILSESGKSDAVGKSKIWVEGEFDCYGPVGTRDLVISVEEGGTMIFSPSNLQMAPAHAWQSAQSENGSSITNNGTLTLPNGLVFNNGAASGSATFDFVQQGGILNLGGVIKGTTTGDRPALHVTAAFNGGTINATGGATIEECDSVTLSGTTIWNVASGVAMDLTSATATTMASPAVTKTGDGSLKLPGVPAALTANGGTTTLTGSSGGTLVGLTVASGATVVVGSGNMTISSLNENAGTISIAAPGLVVSSVDSSATLLGTWTVDAAQFSTGDTVVETSSATIRNAVSSFLAATGIASSDDGSKVTIGAVAEKKFTGGDNASADLTVAGNWECGYVPSGYAVTIDSAADFTASSPVFTSMTVTPNGSLTVANGATLPAVTLQGAATLTIEAGAAVTLPATATGEIVGSSAPQVIIGSGATLTIDADAAYANITFVNNGGTIKRTAGTPLTFKWVGSSDCGDYTNLGNWQMRPTSGGDWMVATRLPCASDQFYNKGDYYFDLKGGSGEVGAWPLPTDWDNHYLSVSNGTFTFNGAVETHSGTWAVTDGGTVRFATGSSFKPGSNSGSALELVVGEDSAFEFYGAMELWHLGSLAVNAGGRAVFDYTAWRSTSDKTANFTVASGGYVSFPHGLVWTSSSGNGTFNLASAGELLLGGDVTKPSYQSLNVSVTGGKVEIVSNVTITADSSTLSGAVELDVADGVGFHLNNFTVDAATTVTKSGAGLLYLDSETAPASLAVNAGTIGFDTANAAIAFPATTTFVSGAKILLAANGLTITPEDAPDNATYSVDVGAITLGAAVVSTSDATLLAKIKSDLESQLSGTTYEVESENGALSIVGVSPYTLTSSDYTQGSSWASGSVPSTDCDVVIHANVTLGTDFPSFASIAIEKGSQVTVSDGVVLPSVTLSLASSMTIADNASVTMGAFTGAATAVQIPVLTVGEGATLTVAGGSTFGNVDLRLLDGAMLQTSESGGLTFGYAAENETAYFAMFATNATIKVAAGNLALAFGCPAAGGTVVMQEAVELVDVVLPEIYGLVLGENNPTTSPFTVLVDGTDLFYHNTFKVAGAATLQVANATLRNAGGNSDYDVFHIAEEGQVVALEGGTIQHHVAGGANQATAVRGSSATERPGVVLAGGSFYPWTLYHASAVSSPGGSDRNRTLSVTADSCYDLANDDFWGRNETAFNRLKSVDIDEDATLYLRRREDLSWGSSDRDFMVATTPITGAGNLFVTNTTPASSYSVTFQGGSNTASGTLSGDENSLISFADGANWAGTVVANGNVVLTNGSAAARVTFGALRLESGTFPIRLWHDAEKDEYAADNINITGSGIDCAGGRFKLVPQGDYSLPKGTKVYLGRWARAAVPTGVVRFDGAVMQFLATAVDGEPDKADVYLCEFSGFVITIR